MTHRFKFRQGEDSFEVIGTYGKSNDQAFLVTALLEGAKRMMRASGSHPSGLKVEKLFQVESEVDLISELRISYPNMTDFEAW